MNIQIKKPEIIPNKELSQNFLMSHAVLEKEVKHANITKQDVVLEIGPGTGNLTELIAQRAKKVIAIEKDTQFKPILSKLASKYPNMTLIFADALDMDIPECDKIVANLPFSVALPLTFKLLKYPFREGVFIYQQSLARKLCANPGQPRYGRISAQVQRRASFKLVEYVKKTSFFPAPDVDCAIIKVRKNRDAFSVPSESYFKQTLDFLFFKRNAYFKVALLGLGAYRNTNAQIRNSAESLHSLLAKRITQLLPADMGRITNVLYNNKIVLPKLSDDTKRRAQQTPANKNKYCGPAKRMRRHSTFR